MTTTIKDSVEANNPGKQGAQSQDSAGKPGEGGRSNPVCLELGVTIRSLPTENGGLTKPIRVEGRSVIVFDNGAVLRCAENLPIGQSFILSNPSGRDVVCLVVGGRNLPSVKGYVEVQFMEPVNDFWGLHEGSTAPVVAAKTPEVRREAAQPSATPAPIPAAPQREMPSKPENMQSSSAPSFDDIGGLLSVPIVPATAATQGRKPSPAQTLPERASSSMSAYSQTGNATPGLVANITSSVAEQAEEKNAKQAVTEALSNALASGPISKSSSSSHDFLSKGVMAYSQSEPKAAALGGRLPMIGGAIALVLAGVGLGAFIMHRGSEPAPVATAAAVTQPVAAPLAAPSNSPAISLAKDAAPIDDKEQLPAHNVAVEQNQVGNGVSAIPAVVSNAVSNESKTDQKAARRAESAANSRTEAAASAPRRPSIANLKMNSPSAPSGKAVDLGAGAAPLADMVATQPVSATAAPGLLTSSGRTSGQPAPPPGTIVPAPELASVPAGKTVSPKLISSAHLAYPPSAKQSGIQGTVTLLVNVDANGVVSNAKALNGPLLLRQAAVDSVRQWKYSPGMTDGKPSDGQVTVAVEFKLN
jgi:TonB family protein